MTRRTFLKRAGSTAGRWALAASRKRWPAEVRLARFLMKGGEGRSLLKRILRAGRKGAA